MGVPSGENANETSPFYEKLQNTASLGYLEQKYRTNDVAKKELGSLPNRNGFAPATAQLNPSQSAW